MVEQLRESFRSGLGLPYDAFGPEGARGVERGFAPWVRSFLVPAVIARVPGLAARLEAGARVADVGCGAGVALLVLAQAFPKAELHGYELSGFDLVLSIDCLHDMTDPDGVAKSIRRAVKSDGVWLIADIKSYPSYAENAAENPMASLMYGFSVLTCMSSALSEPGGAGLGTLGLPEPRGR